jgi:hypothetical protein
MYTSWTELDFSDGFSGLYVLKMIDYLYYCLIILAVSLIYLFFS